ncbi:MAG: hypothetical protein L3J93_02880 [Thermoplasmata archaeon]|nr:hypothetical protein [Thermoplasmata archaeon]
MTPWWKKPDTVEPEIVEQVEPVEIPVITEVKRQLAQSDFRSAILHAYPVVANDLSRAFAIPFPHGTTHEEFLRASRTKKTGHLPEFLQRLYRLYAPIRYGPPGAPESPASLTELLKSIYAQPPMWRLHLAPREAPPAEEPPTLEVGPPAPPGDPP